MTPLRPIILCFISHYLPGFRSGGPVRSIANLVDHFGKEFDIRIVTSDRDVLDAEPYAEIAVDRWNVVGDAHVFYASRSVLTLFGIAKLLSETKHDILYLNSFFSTRFTTFPLLARKLRLAPLMPCIIAPRGELSLGALGLKKWKKEPYICLIQLLGLYSELMWQASTSCEQTDIRQKIGHLVRGIYVAPDLLPVNVNGHTREDVPRKTGPLRLVFLSRISPMKNLDFLLKVLVKSSLSMDLSVYGPIESEKYWAYCRKLVDDLPTNIRIVYEGEIKPEEVMDAFEEYDTFVFPTRGENFGHVIMESLSVGTPVLVSDQTPWKSDRKGGVKAIPLCHEQWLMAIEALAKMDHESLRSRRRAALNYAQSIVGNRQSVQQNRAMFESALRVDWHGNYPTP